jgi:cellulose synthase/poly-beta-1,6-N-acetylglucosamine synthase-like glycosyltransferase
MRDFFLYGYFVILAILSIFGIHRYYTIYLYRKYKNKRIEPEAFFKSLPKVTIQLPMFNEKYVAERLIEKVAKMKYPRHLLEIQVLDDSTDETVEIARNKCKEIAEQGINIKYIHRIDRTGFKAGALEQGLKTSEGEFVAVFDADFLPPEDFLEKTIHYFTSKKIGMVQARWDHLNRNYSILTESQSILLDGHFMIEHTARNRSGRFFNFNGTAGIWRKETIADAGGWQHDTLTEDLDLSYRAQLKGWKFVYLPDLTVPAELPVEMTAFKSQQFRWAKGSIQVFMKIFKLILKSQVPFRVKTEAFFHLGANFSYILMMFLSLLMPINIMLRYRQGWQEVVSFDLPVFIFATISVVFFYFYSEIMVINETLTMKGRSKISPLYFLPFTISIGIGLTVNNTKAVLEALFKKETPFIRTPKYNVGEKKVEQQKENFTKVVSNVYRIKKIDWVSIFELFLGIYFSYAVYFAFYSKLYGSLPFLMLFQIGFLYTAFLSIFYTPVMVFLRKKA